MAVLNDSPVSPTVARRFFLFVSATGVEDLFFSAWNDVKINVRCRGDNILTREPHAARESHCCGSTKLPVGREKIGIIWKGVSLEVFAATKFSVILSWRQPRKGNLTTPAFWRLTLSVSWRYLITWRGCKAERVFFLKKKLVYMYTWADRGRRFKIFSEERRLITNWN